VSDTAREHTVYVNPRMLIKPFDCQHVAGCTTCDWREETVTVEHAKLLAVKHLRETRNG
jgi:hypothetical protein